MKTVLPVISILLVGLFRVPPAYAAPIVPPSIPAGFTNSANTTSPAGSNLAAITDFTAEYPFINHFQMARPWFSAPADGSAFQDDRPLSVDANGNIKALDINQVARTVLFTGNPPTPACRARHSTCTTMARENCRMAMCGYCVNRAVMMSSGSTPSMGRSLN